MKEKKQFKWFTIFEYEKDIFIYSGNADITELVSTES